MSRLTPWKAAVVVAAFVAWPLAAAAQANQQGGTAQSPPQQQPPQQPPVGGQQSPGMGQAQPQGQTGNPQTQGTARERQAALARLTAARQDLADITKLPATAGVQGQARSDLNQLITNFNSLITSTGPEWRQAFDNVQANLAALIGRQPTAGTGEAPVGTSGGGAAPALDPSIAAKLSDMRQQIDQFGEIVGVKPGESATAQANAAGAQGSTTTGTLPNEQALRNNVDQIGAILSRLLSQGTPDQPTIVVSRQDLQQIEQYLGQLRQSLGEPSIK